MSLLSHHTPFMRWGGVGGCVSLSGQKLASRLGRAANPRHPPVCQPPTTGFPPPNGFWGSDPNWAHSPFPLFKFPINVSFEDEGQMEIEGIEM